MKLDPVKLARQEQIFERWREGKVINNIHRRAVGVIIASTGFGKTYIMILAIQYMNKHFPNKNAIVIVPTIKLHQDWTNHIEKHNLQNTRVFVINTYVTYSNWECDFLGIDESHRVANEDSQHFSRVLEITKYGALMAMSATLKEKEKKFFAKFNIPVVDEVTEREAQQFGYVAPASIFNLGIKLSDSDKEFNEQINKKFNSYFAYFGHEFDVIKACNGRKNVPVSIRLKNGTYLGKKTPDQWIADFARINNFDDTTGHPYNPKLIARNAAQAMNTIHERKAKWQNFPSKLDTAVEIIKKFNLQVLVFSETSEFADKLTAKIPDICASYHTNLDTIAIKGSHTLKVESKFHKEELKKAGYTFLSSKKRKELALASFIDKNNPIRVLSTVKALDEGVDIPSISMTIQLAYSSTARQSTQRRGRANRLDYSDINKKALHICLYMEGTQEEKWLRSSQEGKLTRYIESIDDIDQSYVLKLSSNGSNEEIIIEDGDIESGISRDISSE